MGRILSTLSLCWLLVTGAVAQTQDEIAAARALFLEGAYEPALEVLVPAAEAGVANAQNIVATAYQYGNGVAADMATAMMWFERSAAQEFPKALQNLGRIYRNGADGVDADPARAIAYYERAIALGNDWSMVDRGYMHDEGIGGPEDDAAAVALYLQAADLGNVIATYNLGYMREYGFGVARDMDLAMTLYTQAAEGGYDKAIENLAWIFYEGAEGVPPDPGQAVVWAQVGADAGLPDMLTLRGYLHETGQGGPVDYPAALALYEEAAAAGDEQGTYNLAFMLSEEGLEGVETDFPRALEIYRNLATAGNGWAINDLGYFYENGIAVEADPVAAMAYYLLAAESVAGQAAMNVAEAMLDGMLGAGFVDPVRGWGWCLVAQETAEAGDQAAFAESCAAMGADLSADDKALGADWAAIYLR